MSFGTGSPKVFPDVVAVGSLTKSELLASLSGHNIQLNQAAEDLFADPRFQPSGQAVDIKISARSVSSLGFKDGATYPQIVVRARELGMTECPLELAPYLRLQFMNQAEAVERVATKERQAPSGSLTVAAKPIAQADDVPKGFYLRRIDGALWLRGYWADFIHVWSKDDVIVFALLA
jgi:hypothetical protein